MKKIRKHNTFSEACKRTVREIRQTAPGARTLDEEEKNWLGLYYSLSYEPRGKDGLDPAHGKVLN